MRSLHPSIPLPGLTVVALVVLVVLVVLAALVELSHAQGREARGYAGAACQPVEAAVVCPIVRDSAHAPAGPLDVSITVRSSGESWLTCTLHSLGSSGQLIAAFSRSTFSATPATLSFTVPPDLVGFAGSAHLQCVVPPGGAVFHYYVGETRGGRSERP